jgi:prepilin-type N-terminal cleavage/methylation domain-containing protein
MRTRPTRAGFTLIELLIAIVIISILATIAVPLYWRTKARGFEASLQSDLRGAAIMQEQHFERNRIYAADPADLPTMTLSPGVALTITYAATDGWAAVATHPSVPSRHCGFRMGAAPVDPLSPAATPGIVECGDK